MTIQGKLKELLTTKKADSFAAYSHVVRVRFGKIDAILFNDRMVFIETPEARLIIADDSIGESLYDMAANQFYKAAKPMYSDRYTDAAGSSVLIAIENEISK